MSIVGMLIFHDYNKKVTIIQRKAEAKNNSPDLREPTFNLLVVAERSEAMLSAVL